MNLKLFIIVSTLLAIAQAKKIATTKATKTTKYPGQRHFNYACDGQTLNMQCWCNGCTISNIEALYGRDNGFCLGVNDVASPCGAGVEANLLPIVKGKSQYSYVVSRNITDGLFQATNPDPCADNPGQRFLMVNYYCT
jgi:hypothetical protein